MIVQRVQTQGCELAKGYGITRPMPAAELSGGRYLAPGCVVAQMLAYPLELHRMAFAGFA